jgi:nitrile hydratase
LLKDCVRNGLFNEAERAEIDKGRAPAPRPIVRGDPPPRAKHAGYARAIETPPAFKVGDAVRGRNMHPAGHTRLPRYARGKCGVVIADRGGFVFPDTNAALEGEQPKRLYTVRFTARELWGERTNAKDTVAIDLWEPYLERA